MSKISSKRNIYIKQNQVIAKRGDSMVCNCNYNKIKLLYKLSVLSACVEKHAIRDAEKDSHPLCAEECKELKQDLERHIEKLRLAVEGLSREGKFG